MNREREEVAGLDFREAVGVAAMCNGDFNAEDTESAEDGATPTPRYAEKCEVNA